MASKMMSQNRQTQHPLERDLGEKIILVYFISKNLLLCNVNDAQNGNAQCEK